MYKDRVSPFDVPLAEALRLLGDYVQSHIQADHHIVVRLWPNETTIELIGCDGDPLPINDFQISAICRQSHR